MPSVERKYFFVQTETKINGIDEEYRIEPSIVRSKLEHF